MADLAVLHGTYPRDNPGWKMVKKISAEEAATILKIPKEKRTDPGQCSLCKGTRKFQAHQCWECNGSGKADEYLWLNKGYALFDQRPYGSPLKAGDKAVYLHDGKYSILEFEPITPSSLANK